MSDVREDAKLTSRLLPFAALVLIVVAGGIQGAWTGRWRTSRALEEAAVRVDRLPDRIGDWEGQRLPLDDEVIDKYGFAGHDSRRYIHARTGEAATFLIVCGRPGPVSVHTPDVCYRGLGYEQASPATRRSVELIPGVEAEYFEAVFHKPGAIGTPALRIRWCWNSSGAWRAPDSPRLTYGSADVLYKLYVIDTVPDAAAPPDDGAILEFMGLLVQELERTALVQMPTRLG